jgi:hypothetical protein
VPGPLVPYPKAVAAPRDVHIVDSIPLTDVGKIFTPASGRTRRSGRCRLSQSTAYVCAASSPPRPPPGP